jgi:FtsP/CotA-like multicopper oxidase with cupredoxin domain
MIVDIEPGLVIVRDGQSILGHTDTLRLAPAETRDLADQLENEGKHTVAAEGLRRAADQAEGT